MTNRNRLLPARVNTPAQVRQKMNALLQRRGEIIEAEGKEIQKINEELEHLHDKKIRAKRAGEIDGYYFLVLQERAARAERREHCDRLKDTAHLIREGESNAVIDSLYEYLRQLNRDFLYAVSSGQNLEEIYAEYKDRKEEAEKVLQTWIGIICANYTGPPRRRDPYAEARIEAIEAELLER